MLLSIRHRTQYEYAPEVSRAALRLKLYPSVFEGQAPQDWRLSVNGEQLGPLLLNGFGDEEAIWTAWGRFRGIEVIAEGLVETEDRAGVVRGLPEAARPAVFLRQTPLTAPDRAVRALAKAVAGADPLSSLHALCSAVRTAIAYTPGATSAATTAAEALAMGRGVCQDHTHAFLAAARLMGFPARYVVGYLQPGDVLEPGTHAWAEAFVPDLGWVGFDPANNQCPTAAYVRLACGFDSTDAAPVRGCVDGGVSELLSAEVEISQAAAQASQ